MSARDPRRLSAAGPPGHEQSTQKDKEQSVGRNLEVEIYQGMEQESHEAKAGPESHGSLTSPGLGKAGQNSSAKQKDETPEEE